MRANRLFSGVVALLALAGAQPSCAATTVILSTTGTGKTWSTPIDWNNNSNTVYCVGAGGGGAVGATSGTSGGGGGGGGEYKASNLTLSGAIAYQVGVKAPAGNGGTSNTGSSATWFNGTATNAASCGVHPGGGGQTTGAGGQANTTSNSGTLIFNSVAGGAGGSGVGGGGGAGPGNAGGAGAASSGGTGGRGGSAGGLGGSGATSSSACAAGANGSEITTGAGTGGGGGGGAPSTNLGGCQGGSYGAGGGGAFFGGTAGSGAQGVLVVTYTPGVAGTTNYTYDALGRLTCAATPDGYYTSYVLDYADNRSQVVRNTSACALANQSQAPVANNVVATVTENSTNNWITLKVTGGTATSVAVTGAAANGTATASGATIYYTPNGGFSGSDSFQYKATNSAGTSTAATVTVTVNSTAPAGQAPIANSSTIAVLYGSTNNPIPLNITGGTPLAISMYPFPGHGTAINNGTAVTYTPTVSQPANGASTTDSFGYVASNVWGTSAAAGVTININPPTPTAGPIQTTVGYGSTNNALFSVGAGTYNTLQVWSQPSNGTAYSNGQTLFYSPTPGYPSSGASAPDSFLYTITFGSMVSTPGTASITVNGPPTPSGPTANPITLNIQGHSFPPTYGYASMPVDVTPYVSSPQGYTLTVTGVTQPEYGAQYASLSSYSGNTLFYSTTGSWPNDITDQFTYSISDGHGGTATGVVTVHVTY